MGGDVLHHLPGLAGPVAVLAAARADAVQHRNRAGVRRSRPKPALPASKTLPLMESRVSSQKGPIRSLTSRACPPGGRRPQSWYLPPCHGSPIKQDVLPAGQSVQRGADSVHRVGAYSSAPWAVAGQVAPNKAGTVGHLVVGPKPLAGRSVTGPSSRSGCCRCGRWVVPIICPARRAVQRGHHGAALRPHLAVERVDWRSCPRAHCSLGGRSPSW